MFNKESINSVYQSFVALYINMIIGAGVFSGLSFFANLFELNQNPVMTLAILFISLYVFVTLPRKYEAM